MSKPIELSTELSGRRRADIAWLRILAVLLLFPFHTARVFDIWEEFYVKNDQLSTALTYFIAFMEPWHMPLLFLLAGAASWFALGRRSGGRYAGERAKRLLVPFIFGLLVLIPPQSYLGLLSHRAAPRGSSSGCPSSSTSTTPTSTATSSAGTPGVTCGSSCTSCSTRCWRCR